MGRKRREWEEKEEEKEGQGKKDVERKESGEEGCETDWQALEG